MHATNEEIMGKLVASGGKGYDVVFVSSPFAEVLNKLGLTEPIDHAKVPNLANLYPEANALEARSGQHVLGPLYLGHDRPLLPLRPREGRAGIVERPAQARRRRSRARSRCSRPTAGCSPPACSPRAIRSTRPTRPSSPRSKNTLIAAKKTLLAYDDTTFYSKLVSGEALLVHAWDGWCNYGIAENQDIKFVIPKEGSDLWVDTMVVMKASENKDAAFQFINFMLDAKNHAWAAAEHPLQGAEQAGDGEPAGRSSSTQLPEHGMPVADLVKFEQLRDVGEAQKDYSRIVSEIKAAQ